LRVERDSLGELSLPDDALYGAWSARARDNFGLSRRAVNLRLTHAIVKVKKAAALTYQKLGEGAPGVYAAIAEACDIVLSCSAQEAAGMFITDALQGGAGTSTNMNVNEVLANVALRLMGKRPGEYGFIHPLDDVNRGQSTNDVYPTALRIAAIELLRLLSERCASLQAALQRREGEFDDIPKLGRTELMDAVPVTLGGEFGAWAQAIARDRWRLYKVEERLRQVNIGGAAVGVPDRVSRKYRFGVIEELRLITGIGLSAAEYPMDITQNNDVFVEASGLLKALAVNLMKISNDLRLMNSGPHGGLGEIALPEIQAGSTIMPGKVNPVIPEAVMQAAMKVMAGDVAISAAASRGEFELNAFLPLIADTLLENISLLERAVSLFEEKCVNTLSANRERCLRLLESSCAFAASYVPLLGYERVAGIVRGGGSAKEIKEALDRAAGQAGRACKNS
jgi:aspartate ammonia-lyase